MTALNTVPPGRCVRIVRVDAGRGMQMQLKSMGLREGDSIKVLSSMQGRIILAKGNLRIAVGRGMSFRIFVEEDKETLCDTA